MTQSDSPDRFIRREEVANLVGLKTSRLYELIKEGSFPQQVRIGGAVRWSLNEIGQWQTDRLAERASRIGGVAAK